jgi:hypothetical protein
MLFLLINQRVQDILKGQILVSKGRIYEEILWNAIHFEWSLYHKFPLIACWGLALGKQL